MLAKFVPIFNSLILLYLLRSLERNMTALRSARVINGLSFARTNFFLIGACLSRTLLKIVSKEV